MSNARSPREVCSTTIGTNGLMPLLCCLSSTKLTVPHPPVSRHPRRANIRGRLQQSSMHRFQRERVRAPHRLNRESRRHDPARTVPSTRGEQPAPTGADANRPAPDDACTPPTSAVLAGSRLLASRGLLLFLRLCW